VLSTNDCRSCDVTWWHASERARGGCGALFKISVSSCCWLEDEGGGCVARVQPCVVVLYVRWKISSEPSETRVRLHKLVTSLHTNRETRVRDLAAATSGSLFHVLFTFASTFQ
jgi:hypothetical protein